MIEVEIKAKLNKDIEKKVNRQAKYQKKIRQVDTYYNHPNRDFGKTDETLRIRESDSNVLLTYKGPKKDTKSKSREELDIQIGDIFELKKILLKLGFNKVAEVKKVRRDYHLDDFKVSLDTVEELGDFIEIEKIVDEEKYEESLDEVLKLAKVLGIDTDSIETRSYLELLIEKKK